MSDAWLTRASLLARAKDQSDEFAWDEFVSYYEGFIVLVLRKIGMKTSHHDDIVQEILLNLWKGLSKFKVDSDRARFRTWLNTVIKNTAFTYYNKNKNHDSKVFSMNTEQGEMPLESFSESNIDSMIEREWEAYICNLAMKNVRPLFSERALKIFDLFISGVSIDDISKRFDIKENSVYKIKNRVRIRLKEEAKQICSQLEPMNHSSARGS